MEHQQDEAIPAPSSPLSRLWRSLWGSGDVGSSPTRVDDDESVALPRRSDDTPATPDRTPAASAPAALRFVTPPSAPKGRTKKAATTTANTKAKPRSPPSSSDNLPPYTPPYASVRDVPKQFLHGRHQERFTVDEDVRLVELLWQRLQAGRFRERAKWKEILEADAEAVVPFLQHRTSQQLKDRYRIVARNPRLLVVDTERRTGGNSVDGDVGDRGRRMPSPETAEALRRIIVLNRRMGVPR